MTGCRIRVSNSSNANPSSVKWGVIAMPGAKLVFNNTIFQGLGTAIVTYATSEVVLNECHFEQCYEGLRVKSCIIYAFHSQMHFSFQVFVMNIVVLFSSMIMSVSPRPSAPLKISNLTP